MTMTTMMMMMMMFDFPGRKRALPLQKRPPGRDWNGACYRIPITDTPWGHCTHYDVDNDGDCDDYDYGDNHWYWLGLVHS